VLLLKLNLLNGLSFRLLPIPAGIQKVDVPLDNKETKQIWPIKF